MSASTDDRLYELLPAIYRIRDAERGEPLRALLRILAAELSRVEDDVEGLYDNWFIETCQEWVVPYIGDLLGVRGIQSLGGSSPFSARPFVANTLAYRRRKGTAPVLEQIARDVSGWRARAVELFELLATTQHLNHTRPHRTRCAEVRDATAMERVGGPFDTTAHTVEVRRLPTTGGRYNIPNLALHLWRLQAYTVLRGECWRDTGTPGRFRLHPAGIDAPTFNRPRTEREITHLAEEVDVPMPLRRRPLYFELEQLRADLSVGEEPDPVWFPDAAPVLQLYLDGSTTPVPTEEVVICDLSAWRTPPASLTYADGTGALVSRAIAVGVDPVLGRVALPAGSAATRVDATYAYGFSGDVGGGPYDRTASVEAALTREVTWQRGVSHTEAAVPGRVYNSLLAAVDAWNAESVAGDVGVIALLDSGTWRESLYITLKQGAALYIVAAGWPEDDDGDRLEGVLAPSGLRPHVEGTIIVDPSPDSTLFLSGLLVTGGGITVKPGDMGHLELSHTTLAPGSGGGLVVQTTAADESQRHASLEVVLDRAVCAMVVLGSTVPTFTATDSILDAKAEPFASQPALLAPGADVTLQGVTVFGGVQARTLSASDTLFCGLVTVTERQRGCVRFSYLPDGSRTPRRFRCQPDLALSEEPDAAQHDALRARLTPAFTSVTWGGSPGYAQLSARAAVELRTGAESGAEMGVFSHLLQPQRASNIDAGLKSYLRFGLAAGLLFET